MTDEREKILLATQAATTFKPDYMTNDKLEAATKGHGSLVIPVYCAANSLPEDVFCSVGSSDMKILSRMTLVDAAVGTLPLDMVMEKAIRLAMLAGAAPENAALIVATLAYFTGSCARSGASLENSESSGRLRGCTQGRRARVQSHSLPESLRIKSLHSRRTWQCPTHSWIRNSRG